MTEADPRPRAGEFAERLRRYRAERGWTQAQLAAKAGLSRATVTRIESGRERPLERTALVLAEALGVEQERLLGLAGQPALFPRPDELRLDVIRRVLGLDDAQVERAHGSLRHVLEEARQSRDVPTRGRPGKSEA